VNSHPAPDYLKNYLTFVKKIDAFCNNITTEFQEFILCKPGCSKCCRHLSLFPVEGAALSYAISMLSEDEKALLEKHAEKGDRSECPFLAEDICMIYEFRPVICRTHGLPVMTEGDGKKTIDFCPENFKGVDSLPGSAILNLELINRTLVSINSLFLNEVSETFFSNDKRVEMIDIIMYMRDL
jgi:Fe-S-cluster containining protein